MVSRFPVSSDYPFGYLSSWTLWAGRMHRKCARLGSIFRTDVINRTQRISRNSTENRKEDNKQDKPLYKRYHTRMTMVDEFCFN